MNRSKHLIHISNLLHLLVVLIILLLLNTNIYANVKDELSLENNFDTWLIFDATSETFQKDWLNHFQPNQNIGIRVNLRRSNKTNSLCLVVNEQNSVSINSILDQVIPNIKHGQQFVVLFEMDIYPRSINLLKQTIAHYTSILNDSVDYVKPSLTNIFAQEKLLWFSTKHFPPIHPKIHLLNDYFLSQNVQYLEKNSMPELQHEAGYLLGTQYTSPRTPEGDEMYERIEEREKWIDSAFQVWQNSGVQPTFILCDGDKKKALSYEILGMTIKNAHSVKGLVRHCGSPLKNVNWLREGHSSSTGIFHFPTQVIDHLQPYVPGYTMTPRTISVEKNTSKKSLEFKATKLHLNDNLELQMNFTQGENLKSKIDSGILNIQFEKERGDVLLLNPLEVIRLKSSKAYKLNDHSFTISFWVKEATYNPHTNHYFIGTNEKRYGAGLHLASRFRKPYFGFYNNDLLSTAKLDLLKWTHITFSYDKNLKEQKIYVNGALANEGINKTPYMGEKHLYIGKAIDEYTKFPLLMDDLYIWSRCLSAQEIMIVKNGIEPFENTTDPKVISLYLIVFAMLAMGSYLLSILFKSRKSSDDRSKFESEQPLKVSNHNALFIFGKLTLFDRNGTKVTNSLSPMLRELFVYLVVSKLKAQKGVSVDEITNLFWADLSTSKARNNRNVAIAKLRKHLTTIDGINLEYVNKELILQMTDDFFCDFLEIEKLKKSNSPENVQAMFQLIQRGMLLPFSDWSWLQSFQTSVNSLLIDELLSFIHTSEIQKDKSLFEKMCLHILRIDDLNQETLRCLLQYYLDCNKSNLAINIYSNFIETYEKIYGEKFNLDMNEFLQAEKETH